MCIYHRKLFPTESRLLTVETAIRGSSVE